MAVPDGKPATSFNAMDREWVRAVSKEEAGGAIPAPENPSNGDVLTYNSTSGEWEAEEPSRGIPAPASPSDGDVLTYDSDTSEWVAEAPSGGGGVFAIEDLYDDNTNISTLSKTWAEIKTAFEAHKLPFVYTAFTGDTTEDSATINPVIEIDITYDDGHTGYDVYGITILGGMDYVTQSQNGYPQHNWN